MSSSIHGLSWFPNFPDKFVTWGQEISLYEVRPKSESKSRIFLNFAPSFLASEGRYQYVRCVQPSFHKDRPIVAVGLGDGKIGISDFHVTDSGSCLEFTPRQQRMCVCLAWNELDPNVLAIGHDRHRSDTCITIWNIQNGMPTDNFFGNADSAQSLCWDNHHRALIAGMSQKQIRLFDLRQNATTFQPISTKCVYGLSVAPNGYYVCSYFDSIITLWDLRAFERPLKQIQSSKNHFHLSWCPTRTSLLTALQRESPYISLYDIRGIDVEHSREIYHIKKQILPFHNKYHNSNKGNVLTSLSWHSTDFERVLLLSDAGSVLDFKLPLPALVAATNRKKLPLIFQRPITIPVSPTTSNSIASVGMLQHTNSFDCSNPATMPLHLDVIKRDLLEQDPVDETRRRAFDDYGLKNDFESFGDFCLNAYLKNVWTTLKNLYSDERLIGLKELLGIGQSQTSEALMATSRIETRVLQWPDFINNSNHLICYHSEQREKALKLCGWTTEQDLDKFIGTLRENKEFSRAAMIYVFHLKILAACDILSQAADASNDPSMFRIAAIALSSFNADNSSTWRNQRSNANMQIQDAYLRAIFSFLTTDNEQFDAVLSEEGIPLADRMSFACKYLSENKLAEYVKQQIQKCTEKGDLNGLLLTGETPDTINILQAYMDATSDVQTVALLAINFFSRDCFGDNRIQFWISSYLNCLNSWGLWVKRAELEIKIGNTRPYTRNTRCVYLSCNFCGKSISTTLQDEMRLRSASSNINKLSSCPSCRKPLPRCSLCQLHMGTTLNTANSNNAGQESLGWQSKPFSKWFSWCQTCRHGGHTEHLLQWFKQNSECPVSSCSCRCFDLDATISNSLRDAS